MLVNNVGFIVVGSKEDVFVRFGIVLELVDGVKIVSKV